MMEQKRVDADVILAAGGLVWRDSPRGKELAVIHRIRYGDWTLPKGKVVHGEGLQDTALREVKEETGCDVRLGNFLGCVCYIANDVPKVVLFWNMTAEGECAFKPDDEVDQLIWLSPREALDKLDYPNERDFVRKQNKLEGTDE